MNEILSQYIWSQARLGEALKELARIMGVKEADLTVASSSLAGEVYWKSFGEQLGVAASQSGLDVEPIYVTYGNVNSVLFDAVPLFLEYADSETTGFLFLLREQGQKIILLQPNGIRQSLSVREFVSLMHVEDRESWRQKFSVILNQAGVARADVASTLDALVLEKLKDKRIGTAWRLHVSPGFDFWMLLQQAGVIRLLLGFFVATAVTYGFLLSFWGVLGKAIFGAAINSQTIWLLVTLLLVLGPLRLIGPWLYGTLSIRFGERLKQRLLYGILRLEPEEVRHQGTGQFLGRVIEAESIETSAMRGSADIFMGLIQLVITIPYLVFGAGGWIQVVSLFLWVIATLGVGWSYVRARIEWSGTRLDITHDLVEQMLGYRTRLAQHPREDWHRQEEQLLGQYDALATKMDHRTVWLKAVMPRGWILIGLLTMMPALISLSPVVEKIALGVSGMVFAFTSFQQIADGLTQFGDAWVAWDQVRLIFDAAGRPTRMMTGNQASGGVNLHEAQLLLSAKSLRFQYDDRLDSILNDCSLSIRMGDRILLLGPSGSGKSTLTAILSGLRMPQDGSLTFNGSTSRDGIRAWRKRIVVAPQFQENHIFTESLAFNLLMGRSWPPTWDDLEYAREVCNALDLDDLLDRMPGGMFQIVGETGWQLSHGEKSRVYIARALLQGADIVILDESFSALDVGSLRKSLECAIKYAPTLLVVAHP